jgi:RNA-binding protein Musashi
MENSNKIFIGGLSWTTTQEKLRKYFEQYGPVKDCVLMVEKETGRSRGFGFVVMESLDDVQKIL